MADINVPPELLPLLSVFDSDNTTARKIITEAAGRQIPDEEFAGILGLLQQLRPQDDIQAIYAAQILLLHVRGLRLLCQDFREDRTLGTKTLKACHEAMLGLQQKKTRGMRCQ
jgi:hypothetical protein